MNDVRTYVQPTTRAQREALFRVFQRDFPNWVTPRFRVVPRTGERIKVSSAPYRRFRKPFRHYTDGYIGAMWKGMFLGIEKDGYTHS
jgi:hypothetical protein